MLSESQRLLNYRSQNGGSFRLTPAQRRRVDKKFLAQSPAAQSAREARTAQRVAEAARRKDRRHLPTS